MQEDTIEMELRATELRKTMELEKRRRQVLTKTVNPEWYRRYAKVLNYEDRIFYQPLREIREEKKMLKALEIPEDPDDKAQKLSRELMEMRKKKIKMVLLILEGNFGKLDLSALKKQHDGPLSALSQREEQQVQTLFWRKRAIRPPGYVLSPHSYWRLFWEDANVMKKMQAFIMENRSAKIRARWIKAFRLFQSIYRFNQVLSSEAGCTDELFRNFRVMETQAGTFQKNHFRASAVGKNLDEETMFTLSKPGMFRTYEEACRAANSLRVMQTFAEFPRYLQEYICQIAWYLELEPDKMIIREGHVADSFYFLLSGRVAAVKLDVKLQSNYNLLHQHSMGALIGSEGFDGNTYREYSAYTMEKCKLIAVNFDDFHQKCLELPVDGNNPPHISFLSQLTFMKYFPMQTLVDEAEGNVYLFYFIADSIVERNVAQSQFIYIVYKGSCRVLAKIPKKKRTVNLVHVPPFFHHNDHKEAWQTSSVPELPPIYQNEDPSSRQMSPGRKTSSRRHSPFGASPSSNPTIDMFAKVCGRRTIADTIKSNANLNMVKAASMEKFLTSRPLKTSKREHKNKEWIQFKILREGDVIGLEGLDLGDEITGHSTAFDVVSEGAEVLIILKSFFMENASERMKMDLRASSYINPDEHQLRSELDRRSTWRRFQDGVMNELLTEGKGMLRQPPPPPPRQKHQRREPHSIKPSVLGKSKK